MEEILTIEGVKSIICIDLQQCISRLFFENATDRMDNSLFAPKISLQLVSFVLSLEVMRGCVVHKHLAQIEKRGTQVQNLVMKVFLQN